jgi:hypothetical protein
MTNDEILKFLGNNFKEDRYIKISFKKRDPVYGLFIKDRDYENLSSKNFWRIVLRKNFDAYKKSHDVSLAKIFNGSEFSGLSLLKDPSMLPD